MALRVLNVAYPFAPVHPDAVGGAEQVLGMLDAALVKAGHTSVVVAPPGSRVAGELVPTASIPAKIDDLARHRAWRRHRFEIRRALSRRRIDVIHLHGVDFMRYLPPAHVPTLATLHLPVESYPALWAPAAELHLHCVSRSQASTFPSALPVIENGVPIPPASSQSKRRFALALGRICPEKNFAAALDATREAGIGCLLGGMVFPYPEHESYYRKEIEPRLDGWRRFIGPIGGARKRRLLAAARCVLLPSLVAETSSLVAMEALAAGTPLIAYPSGALREIVEHGRTGFLVSSPQEMAEAIRSVGNLRSADCRESAMRRFPAERMCSRYLAVYEEMAARAREVQHAS